MNKTKVKPIIRFNRIQDLTSPIITLSNVFYSDFLSDISLDVGQSSRIAIVGQNGVGKSTLLKILSGELTPDRGTRIVNPRLRIGKYDQHIGEYLTMNETATEYLMRRHALLYHDARKQLASFGIVGDAQIIVMNNLSGGQKSRVAMIDVCLSRPDILLLDEPTNHLDIETIEGLIIAINAYEGAVILVSHNQKVISDTCCTLHVIEDGELNEIDGTFEDYRDEILGRSRLQDVIQ